MNVTFAPNQTCEDFVESKSQQIKPIELTYDKIEELKCFADDDDIDTDSGDYSFAWKHNCKNFSNNKKRNIEVYLNEEAIGNYVCSITYKGMTRYISYQSICLKRNVLPAKPTFVCDKSEVLAFAGDDVTFRCKVTFGIGNPNRFDLSVEWQKENLTINSCWTKSESSDKSRCFVNYGEKCRRNPNNTAVDVIFNLKNINESTYGKYILRIITSYKISNNYQITLMVLRDSKPERRRDNIVIVVCSVAFLVLIILISLTFYNLIYLQVYFKRYFEKALPDDKLYGVFLVYYYSEELDRFAKEDIQNFVIKIHQLLNKMGYAVYDQNQDRIAGDSVESVQNLMKNSHRILIFLTTEFIKDDWSVFSLQSGFKEMVNSGTKLIFVLPPGVRKHIKQQSSIKTDYKYIERAIKINHIIEWPKNISTPSKCALFKLEYALPKLQQNNHQIIFSVDQLLPNTI